MRTPSRGGNRQTSGFREAAHRSAEALSGPAAHQSELERARQILLLAGDGEGAARLARRAGDLARSKATAAHDRGDVGGALGAWFDSAEAFDAAGDKEPAQTSAREFLKLWPAFEESKRLDLRSARSAPPALQVPKRLRRLPKGGSRAAEEARPAAVGEEESAPGLAVLPSLFIEMHARALRMAGRDAEAAKRYEEALAAIEAEVARRRALQEWAEALSAAKSMLLLAEASGDRARVQALRPDLIAVAREAAHAALSADYFVRGREEVPASAIALAALEAHALGNEAIAAKYEAEAADVLERTAELLVALSDPATCAQAVLSWEDAWPMLSARGDLKRALLDDPSTASTLTGPFGALAGLAPSHPLRLEVGEFLARIEEATSRAQTLAPAALERAARARMPLDARAARDLAVHARQATTARRAQAPPSLLSLLRDTYLADEDAKAAGAIQQELVDQLSKVSDAREAALRKAALAAEMSAGGALAARSRPAVAALAAYLTQMGEAAYERGESDRARRAFEEAASLGHPAAHDWLRLQSLARPLP